MIKKLKQFKLKNALKIEPSQFLKCMLFAIPFKFMFLFWHISEFENSQYPNCLLATIEGGDSVEYITSAYNIFQNNYFFPNGKMPLYSIIISFFIKFFGINKGLDFLIIFQTLVGCVSIYFFAKIVYLLTNSVRFFNYGFFAYLISTYVNVYDKQIMTETLTTSLIIIIIYLLLSVKNFIDNSKLFLIGLNISFIIFLKPIFIILFILTFIIFIFKFGIIKSFTKIFIVMFPFLIFECFWIPYKIKNFNDSHPLMSFKYYDDYYKNTYYLEAFNFIEGLGLNGKWWDSDAHINFFYINNKEKNNDIILPNYIYTYKFNLDSLNKLNDNIILFEKTKSPEVLKIIKSKFNDYYESFKNEKSIYFVLSKFITLKRLVFNSGGTYNLFKNKLESLSITHRVIKLFYVFYFLSFTTLGIVFTIIFLFFKNKEINFIIIPIFIILYLGFLCFYFFYSEFRYFIPIYPLCIIVSLHGIYNFNIIDLINSKIKKLIKR